MCLDNGFEFSGMYAMVGIWNAIFLAFYAFFGVSTNIIKWCSRFVQEIFAMFIVCALIVDAFSDMFDSKFKAQVHSFSCTNNVKDC